MIFILSWLLISIIISYFVMKVEDTFILNVEPDGHELTDRHNKVILLILCFIPVVQILVFMYYVVKLIAYKWIIDAK